MRVRKSFTWQCRFKTVPVESCRDRMVQNLTADLPNSYDPPG